jgi:hypothetical protein
MKKMPKLALRQGLKQQTPPPLAKWDLNEFEKERWEALTMQQKALSKKDIVEMSTPIEKQHKQAQKNFKSKSKLTPVEISTSKDLYTQKKLLNQETSPIKLLKSEINPINSYQSHTRPILMPSLEAAEFEYFSPANSMLERSERMAAVEPIDQNSVRFQIKLRKNLEKIHEEDIKAREDQWKDKISKTKETYEKLKKRNNELEEVLQKYQIKKISESEASKEISKLLELKSRTSDEINELLVKKTEMEITINELHLELERNSSILENKERNLLNELDTLHKQINMSDNEKIEYIAIDKEKLEKRKLELVKHKQELLKKWQSENNDFNKVFENINDQKNEIQAQLKILKQEKEMLVKEKELLREKEEQFKQEQDVRENNKKTLMLYQSFQDPKVLQSTEVFDKIIKDTAQSIYNNLELNSDIKPTNQYSEYLDNIKQLHIRRKRELISNSYSQIEIINQQIKENEIQRTKSTTNLYALKKFIKN